MRNNPLFYLDLKGSKVGLAGTRKNSPKSWFFNSGICTFLGEVLREFVQSPTRESEPTSTVLLDQSRQTQQTEHCLQKYDRCARSECQPASLTFIRVGKHSTRKRDQERNCP